MKIVNKLHESLLVEEEGKELTPEETAENVETVVETDPSKDSTAEVADAIQAGVELATEGEATISDEAAKDAAEEAKEVAKDIGASSIAVTGAGSEEALGTQNAVTRILDKALHNVQRFNRQGNNKARSNVLIEGLPGSGKTASVYEWAAQNGINIHYLDAKNPDLETVINGFAMRDLTVKDKNEVTQAFSKALAPLDRPNSVLFLDELNRQTKEHIRASLYTLIQEKAIVGDDKNGRHVFPNLLFTIACINPALPTDKGAARLNSAERSRFNLKLQYDSNSEAALDYFTKHYDKLINKLVANVKANDGKPTDDEVADYIQFRRQQDLAKYIVSHPTFMFDNRDDEQELADTDRTQLNQRSLADMIENAEGGLADNFKNNLEFNDLLDRDAKMLFDIANQYADTELPDQVYADQFYKLLGQKEAPKEIKAKEEEPKEAEVEAEEDDADFFAKPAGGKEVVTPSEVSQKVAGIADSWF